MPKLSPKTVVVQPPLDYDAWLRTVQYWLLKTKGPSPEVTDLEYRKRYVAGESPKAVAEELARRK